jgi:hypothetical protein
MTCNIIFQYTSALSSLHNQERMLEHFKLPVNAGKHNYHVTELLEDLTIFHTDRVHINNATDTA